MKGINSFVKHYNKINKLIDKGVRILNPETVLIGDDVDLKRISGNGVEIYPGCRIFGSSTYISHNVRLGYEGPVMIDNCKIGPYADLKGGFISKGVFLEKASMGNGVHVREGTILEEESSCAHTVGLKQTILFPFVTLGSLINFCDCFISGGTSRKNHSEVGSSYIHFNYTPNQDKATPSLLGDVPRGVMLDQKPIFLGGQGGLVGPCRLEFGTLIAAGSIWRKDELRPQRLLVEGKTDELNVAHFEGNIIKNKRIIKNNIIYIANLIALFQWYDNVRSLFISENFPEPLLDGLRENVCIAVKERLKRLKEFLDKVAIKDNSQMDWGKAEIFFKDIKLHNGDDLLRETFLKIVITGIKSDKNEYLSVIKNLKDTEAETGTMWLQGIVDEITDNMLNFLYI